MGWVDAWSADVVAITQYQEAKDLEISLPEGHRPQVPKKPQTCAARNDEGPGSSAPESPGCRDHRRVLIHQLQKEFKEGKRETA